MLRPQLINSGRLHIDIELRRSVPIKQFPADSVGIHGKNPGQDIERRRNRHGRVEVTGPGSHCSSHWGDSRAAGDGRDEHTASAVGVVSQAAERKGENGCEAGLVWSEALHESVQ